MGPLILKIPNLKLAFNVHHSHLSAYVVVDPFWPNYFTYAPQIRVRIGNIHMTVNM